MRASTRDRRAALGAWVCNRISVRESNGILSHKIPYRFHPVSEFVFGTYGAAFVQAMYEDYLRDPASVGPEWRELFDNGKLGELPIIQGAGSREQGAVKAPASPAPVAPAPSSPLPAPPGATPITGPAARLVANMTDSLTVPTATSFRDISATT